MALYILWMGFWNPTYIGLVFFPHIITGDSGLILYLSSSSKARWSKSTNSYVSQHFFVAETTYPFLFWGGGEACIGVFFSTVLQSPELSQISATQRKQEMTRSFCRLVASSSVETSSGEGHKPNSSITGQAACGREGPNCFCCNNKNPVSSTVFLQNYGLFSHGITLSHRD